jgi:hypothetical protein
VHSKENNLMSMMLKAQSPLKNFDLVEILGKIISKTNKPYHLIILSTVSFCNDSACKTFSVLN